MSNKKVLSRLLILILFIIGIGLGCATNLLLSSISNDNNKSKIYVFDIEDIKNPKFTNTVVTVNAKENTKSRILNTTTKTSKSNKNNSKNKYSKSDLYILSHVINGEAGGSTYKDKLYVGSVVLNRVKDKRFPNTIKGVVFQRQQYACTWDGNYNKKPNKDSIKAAKYLLKNGSQLPKKVVWQSQVKQGDGVYLKENRHYYCY